jgi:ElaA protein
MAADKLQWSLKRGDELTAAELYNILKLRQDIFIIEQQSIYEDIDGLDLAHATLHIIARDDLNKFVGYSRSFIDEKSGALKTGRIVLAKEYRGSGLGRELFARTLDEICKIYPAEEIKLSAQCYLEKFYSSFGFVKTSEPYDDAGIDHIDMVLEKSKLKKFAGR